MADIIDFVAEDLYFKLRNRFPKVQMGDKQGKVTSDPFSARFFNFQVESGEGKYGSVTLSIIDSNSLKIYFSQDLLEDMTDDYQDKWFAFLKEMRRFSKGHMLMFDVRDITKKSLDADDIKFISSYNARKNELAESKVEWERKGSRSNGKLAEVKIRVVHKDRMEENPHNRLQRIDKIYLVNGEGEKFLLPFNSVLGAKAMAYHVSRGGTPYDVNGQTICKAVSEMRNLQRFYRMTKKKQYESENTARIINATAFMKEDIKKCLTKLANNRNFDECLEELNKLTKMDDPKVSEEIQQMFIQKHYDERLNGWMQSAATAYKNYEEKKMSGLNEVKGSVIQKIMDPNFKLILKKDDAMDKTIASSKYSNQNGMISRVLADIADRLITPDADDVANYAAQMADTIGSEGSAFGQRMTDDYKKEKALAVRLVAKYVGDMNKIKANPDYASEVRKDPAETMGPKKDRKGKAKTEAESYEDYINKLGEDDYQDSVDAVEGAITWRIMNSHPEVLKKHGLDKVTMAIRDEAEWVGDVDEIGSSDVSIWTKNVLQSLERQDEGNEFSGALAQAKKDGKKEFEVDGKKYKVKESAEVAVNEAWTSKDAISTLANLRKIGKQVADSNQPHAGNLANEYGNSVWQVYSWLQNNANVNDPKLKAILQPIFALRAEAKEMEGAPKSGANKSFANQIVNALYPLITWIEDNVKVSEAAKPAFVSNANPRIVIYNDSLGQPTMIGNMDLETFMDIYGISTTYQGKLAQMVIDAGKGEKVSIPNSLLRNSNDPRRYWIELSAVKDKKMEEGYDDVASQAQELINYGENNRDLYRQRTVPIQRNLTKKFNKGVYDSALAAKLWQYWADDAAMRYAKEHGSPNQKWSDMFPKMVRRVAADIMASQWEQELEAGNAMESDVNEASMAELKKLVDEYNAAMAGMSDADENQLAQKIESMAKELGVDPEDITNEEVPATAPTGTAAPKTTGMVKMAKVDTNGNVQGTPIIVPASQIASKQQQGFKVIGESEDLSDLKRLAGL